MTDIADVSELGRQPRKTEETLAVDMGKEKRRKERGHAVRRYIASSEPLSVRIWHGFIALCFAAIVFFGCTVLAISAITMVADKRIDASAAAEDRAVSEQKADQAEELRLITEEHLLRAEEVCSPKQD